MSVYVGGGGGGGGGGGVVGGGKEGMIKQIEAALSCDAPLPTKNDK